MDPMVWYNLLTIHQTVANVVRLQSLHCSSTWRQCAVLRLFTVFEESYWKGLSFLIYFSVCQFLLFTWKPNFLVNNKIFHKKMVAFKGEFLGEDWTTYFLFRNSHFLLGLTNDQMQKTHFKDYQWWEYLNQIWELYLHLIHQETRQQTFAKKA